MKKLILILLFLFLAYNPLSAQLILKIDSVKVSNIIEIREKNVISSHWGDGPSLAVNFSLINNTDSVFFLSRNHIVINIEGNGRDGSRYNQFLWASFIADKQIQCIESHKSISQFGIASLLLFVEETEFANCYISDYLPELERLAPSLEIVLIINYNEICRIPIDIRNQLIVDDVIHKLKW